MSIFNKLQQIVKNDFNRNFITLFSGSAVAQIIPLVASVILVRVYTPEELGVFTIFTSLVLIFVSLVNLRYEFAIPLVGDENKAIALTLLSGIVAIVFSGFLYIIFFFAKDRILTLIGGQLLGNWLYVVPLVVLLSGLYNCLNYLNLRFKEYKVIAMSNIVRSASNATLQSVFGFIGLGLFGLISGNVLSFLAGNSRMFNTLWKKRDLVIRTTKKDLKIVAFENRKFPLISIWGVIINNLSLNINNFLIPRMYGVSMLAYYGYSYKNLNMPLSLISGNIGQVFYQKCIELKNGKKELHPLFIAVMKKILIILVPVFLVFFFFIEDLFALVYGENWRVAGTFSKILLPLFLCRSVFSPLSMVTLALNKQLLMTGMQVIILLTNISLFLVSFYLKLPIIEFLIIYSLGTSLMYLLLLSKLYMVSKKYISEIDEENGV